ncbi:MAG: hypothetical protein M0Z73_02600 [Betaproteobacteria bacterium]|nr:hypothetical protein [Betaproteobacteria bacterium]
MEVRIVKTDDGKFFIGDMAGPFDTEEEVVRYCGVDASAMKMYAEAGIEVSEELARAMYRKEVLTEKIAALITELRFAEQRLAIL